MSVLVQAFEENHPEIHSVYPDYNRDDIFLYKYYLYENENDIRYLPSEFQRSISGTGFIAGGTMRDRTDRTTKTLTFKGDLVAQFGNHEIKTGFEFRKHQINYENFNVEIVNPDGSTFNTSDLLANGTDHLIRRKPDADNYSLITTYEKHPQDAALYIVDKMELTNSFILNIGLRYEYFDAKSHYNSDLTSDLEDFKQGVMSRNLKPTEVKQYLSPRLSISYPITSESVIRFSYGHFFQNGNLASLYRNNNFYVTNFGSTPTFGNANVDMQRSIQYELGLQQQLGENLKIELTGYFKDVRDYIYTQTVQTNTGRRYGVLTNLAYSNVSGVSFRFERRRPKNDLIFATLDYTFQLAQGNRTEPQDDLFFSEASGQQTETYLVPMNFNRAHVVNISLGLYEPDNWRLGVIFNIQSGTPYTPAFPSSYVPITFEQNSGNQLFQNNLDFKLEKFFEFGGLEYSVFLWIKNLFDFQSELNVYTNTGRALSSLEETTNEARLSNVRDRIDRGDQGLIDIYEIDNYYS